MTPTPVAVEFSQHCRDCGGVFSIDQFEATSSGFRVRLTIENTGEHGTLNLVMDGCRMFAMEKDQASWWVDSYPWFRAQGRAAWELYDKVTSAYGLRAVQEDVLPHELLPGGSWSGWFESTRSLDEKTVAVVGFFGPFRRQRPRSFMTHLTLDETRPFVSLQGEVTVKPASILKKRAGWALAWARCFWRLEYLGIVVGGITGALADIYLGTDPLFQLLGLPAGWYLFHLIARSLREGRG